MPRRTHRESSLPFPDVASSAAPAAAIDPERALTRGGAADVLARVADGDPFALASRVARRARERWLLVDPTRAAARAQAVAAWRVDAYRAGAKLETWLDACVEEALDQLSQEEDATSAGLARYHRLPSAVREAFCRVVLDGESIEDLARRRGTSVSAIGRDARRAIDALWPEGGSSVR